MLNFKNDYSEGACPEVLEALIKTNYEQTVGYGEDEYCKEARNLIKENINYPNALVTVKSDANDSFFLQLDDSTTGKYNCYFSLSKTL